MYSSIFTSGVSADAGIWLADICYTDTPTFKTKVEICVSLKMMEKLSMNRKKRYIYDLINEKY